MAEYIVPCRFFHRWTTWYPVPGMFRKHCVKCGDYRLER